jgi:tetratricopeptide (TPR) repeat protein
MRRTLSLAALLLTHWPTGLLAAQVRLKPGVTVRGLEAVAARDSNDQVALYDLALGYWSKRRWDDVERTLRQSIAIEPRYAPALIALAHLQYARRPQLWEEDDRGEVPPEWQATVLEGDRLTRRAFLIDPLVDLQIVGAVAPKNSIIGHGGGDATPEQYALLGLTHFRNAQFDQAFAWFDRLARVLGEEKDRSHIPPMVFWYRGIAAAHLNDIPAALRDFKLLHELGDSLDPGQPVDPVLAGYVYAFLLQRTGRFDEAIATYHDVLARDLGLWMAHVQLARIYDERGQWADAIQERRQAINADPDDQSLILDLGITLFLAGRPEEAAPVLAEARAALPRNFRTCYFQGMVALQRGRPAEAREAFERFLRLVPGRYADETAEVRGRLRELP